MTPTCILLVVFATTTLLVLSSALLIHDVVRYRILLRERIDGLSGKAKGDGNASLFKDLRQFDADASRARTQWRTQFQNMLEQANLRIGLPFLALISLSCGIVLATLSCIASKQWWIAPIAFTIGMLAPVSYVRLKCFLRTRRLVHQLPEAFDAIGRAVRAGQTTTAAFQIVGDEFESPISDEFRRCYEEQSLGMPHDTTLRNLASRTGIMELRIFVVALLMQSRSGGNLTELLSNLSTLVRKRIKLQQKVKSLTGEGRMQATILIVLPVLAFAALRALSPHYISSLLERPGLLAVAGAAQIAGAIWIRHIINFAF